MIWNGRIDEPGVWKHHTRFIWNDVQELTYKFSFERDTPKMSMELNDE